MKAYRFNLFGTFLIITGVIYGCLQSACYGNSGVPHSTPEAICDLITVLIILVGYVLCTLGSVFQKEDEE